jgi:hypothetical protein
MIHKKLTSLFFILILIVVLFTNHDAWADSNEELIRLNKEVDQLHQKGEYSEAIEIVEGLVKFSSLDEIQKIGKVA